MEFNIKLEQLKNTIMHAIADSQLPIGSAYYLLYNITHELEYSYQHSLMQARVDNIENKTQEQDMNE